MRVLLTGGSGFVGRHLSEALGDAHEVLAPPHAELNVNDDGAVAAFLARTRVDVVLHAAVRGGADVVETTLRGYRNLVRCLPLYGRLVTFGSGAEYGKHRDLAKVREEEIGREVPRDPYGFAKLLVCEDARRNPQVTVLRLFGLYGAHENPLLGFVSNAIAKAQAGLPIRVRQNVTFDYLEGDDLGRIVKLLLARGLDGVSDVNVTPDASIRLDEILRHVEEALGRPLDVAWETPGLNYAYTGDNARLRALLPGVAFTPYRDGIARLAARRVRDGLGVDRAALERDVLYARSRAREAS